MQLKKVMLLTLLSFSTVRLYAQFSDSTLMLRSIRISNMFRDSLRLTVQEYNRINQINFQILKQKTTIMQDTANRLQTGRNIQRVENTRDSLYQIVLPAEKFLLYRQLKPVLLSVQ